MAGGEHERVWDFAIAPPRIAPGVASMVGYRALDNPGELHRGMPSSTLTFIVSLDDGVEAAESAETLLAARPNPLLLGGLHVQAAHIRQRTGQTGVQLAVHPLAARALFGAPSAELNAAQLDATAVLGRSVIRLRDRVSEARQWADAFGWIAEICQRPGGTAMAGRSVPRSSAHGDCWRSAVGRHRWVRWLIVSV